MNNPDMERIPCVLMRGGTSKAVFLLGNSLPKDQKTRDEVILALYGSPDRRQIDGLGGADPLTSKLAIIDISDREDADIDYTFGQVDILTPFVDYSSNCGNISSAVGPFSIEQGLVKAVEPITTVRIYNTNTKKVFSEDIPVRDGRPCVKGDYKIDGVPGTGARIAINMAGTIGAKTGRLLPTGNPVDEINVKGFGKLQVSIVDAASPMVFVRAKDLGLTGTETPSLIDSDPRILALLEEIRTHVAVLIGIAPDQETARTSVRAVPMIAFVSEPKAYKSHIDGTLVSADQIDFVSRDMFMQIMHKTYSGTATVCTGCAAVTPGTIVNEVMGRTIVEGRIRIGHPGGVIECDMKVENGQIIKAAYGRTARRIMEGYAYIPYEIMHN